MVARGRALGGQVGARGTGAGQLEGWAAELWPAGSEWP